MYLRCLLAICLALFAPSSLSFAQDSPPLTSEELREILVRLVELQAARERIAVQAEHIGRLDDLRGREAALHAEELELRQRLVSIAERERDVEQRRADQLAELLDARGRGDRFGCVLKKIFTIGLARCG